MCWSGGDVEEASTSEFGQNSEGYTVEFLYIEAQGAMINTSV